MSMNYKTLESRTIMFRDELRAFDVIDSADPNLENSSKYFISYNDGHPLISDDVPSEYQKPMVFHELYEFEVLPSDMVGRCLAALQKELELIPPEKMSQYTDFRKESFEDLANYLSENKGDLLPEIQKSLEYLRSINQREIQ